MNYRHYEIETFEVGAVCGTRVSDVLIGGQR